MSTKVQLSVVRVLCDEVNVADESKTLICAFSNKELLIFVKKSCINRLVAFTKVAEQTIQS